jgi:excisionase family DNA binding protein
MLTVPEAARRVDRDPETVRRWIRSGKLRSRKVGTQHLIDEEDLELFVGDREEGHELLPLPEAWRTFADGTPQPDWVRIIRRSRDRH